MTVFVRNEQRRFKINRPLLCELTHQALRLIGAADDTTIGIILLNDRQIAEFNERFHHTPGPTDILTFHFPELAGGELTISVERASAQARRFRSTPSRELALYVIHGLLHLHGYDDRAPRQRARMRAAERRLLARLSASVDLRPLVQASRPH